jgi:hypothetical protein
VHDLADDGLQFQVGTALNVEDKIRMEVQLDTDCIIHCELFLPHANLLHFGGRVAQRQQLVLHDKRPSDPA